MDPDGPARVRQRGCAVAVEQDEAVDGGSDPQGDRAVEGDLQLSRHRHGIRSLGAPNEVDDHRSPEPGDPTERPRGRLLGGTGGPVVAEVADRQFRHLVSHHDPVSIGPWQVRPKRPRSTGRPRVVGNLVPLIPGVGTSVQHPSHARSTAPVAQTNSKPRPCYPTAGVLGQASGPVNTASSASARPEHHRDEAR